MEGLEAAQPETRALFERIGRDRFELRVEDAAEKVRVIERVEALKASGMSEVEAVREAGEGLSRTGYRNRKHSFDHRSGMSWERAIDRRVPVKSWKVPDTWKSAAVALQMHQETSFEQVRAVLVKQFGPEARISDSTLRNIYREAGIEWPGKRGKGKESDEQVVELTGGASLVLMLAAAAETEVFQGLAKVIGQTVEMLEGNPDAVDEPSGRDEQGRFTAEYNHEKLAGVGPDEPDPRFRSVEELREEKDLSRLSMRGIKPETLEDHLMVAMATPMLEESRGMVALDSPKGERPGVMSEVAYGASTMDKFLRELKYAGASEAMWDGHLEHWSPINARWTQGKGFRQYVAYLDGSQDPWWTKNYALSGKVSRVGRVMPSMSRLLLCGGAGTPLLVETYAGQASIKKQLHGILERVDEILDEEGELGRLLVVDAELMSVKLFEALDAEGRQFITVLKGAVLRNLKFEPTAETTAYRQRDTLRDGVVELSHPDKAKGSYAVRVVEMIRQDSRHPTPTYFATNAPVEEMDVATVATAYLERWPHNEQVFRRARHGAGMQHSHGFGHRSVHNVAVVTEREKVQSRLAQVHDREQKTTARVESLREELESEKQTLQALREKRDSAVYVKSARRKVD